MGNISSQIQPSEVFRPFNLFILFVTLYGVETARKFTKARAALARVGNMLGPRAIFGPYSLLGKILPPIPYVKLSSEIHFGEKYAFHQKYGCDVIADGYIFDPNQVYLRIADAAVVKQLTTNRIEFPKPLKMYKSTSLYGTNVVATEFDEWKRHRRIVAPSFNERNNRLVYEETARISMELLDVWSANGENETFKVDNVVTFTSRLALMVISAAGFGYRFGWDEMKDPPAGHQMTFPKALSTVLSNFILRLILSDRILKLWKGGRNVLTAFKELRVHMREMIEERRQTAIDGSNGQADLFTNLINGTSLEEDEKTIDQLTDEELMGNVFIFLFAGHETTANSMGFTLALLATHQDIQEKAFQELRDIVPEGEQPAYTHIMKWAYGLAVTYESLRMYPPVTGFPKYAAEDTVIVTTSADGKNTPITIPVPKGTDLLINLAALHYNPKYWDEPEVFRPERFLGNYNRDAFMPFAAGPRGCIGRRFSELEALTFLAHLLLNYRFEGTPLNDKETPAQMKERLLQWSQGPITLCPKRIPLTFTRRRK